MRDNILVTDAEKKAKEASSRASATPPVADGIARREGAEGSVEEEQDGPTPEGGHAQEKTNFLVGKINNLVTTDLAALGGSQFIVSVRECLASCT